MESVKRKAVNLDKISNLEISINCMSSRSGKIHSIYSPMHKLIMLFVLRNPHAVQFSLFVVENRVEIYCNRNTI